MFTVKHYKGSDNVDLYQCEEVSVGRNAAGNTFVSMTGPGNYGFQLGIGDSDTVYIENEHGKTVHVLKPVVGKEAA